MYEQKIATKHVSQMTIHFMASTIINAFCDIILHNIPKNDALKYISDIIEFTESGMYKLLGIARA
ncbi:MAG TPA: hypothetical protein DCF70_00065 [Treponema sp.]|nr:hypothetical protein [Treponema sp.]